MARRAGILHSPLPLRNRRCYQLVAIGFDTNRKRALRSPSAQRREYVRYTMPCPTVYLGNIAVLWLLSDRFRMISYLAQFGLHPGRGCIFFHLRIWAFNSSVVTQKTFSNSIDISNYGTQPEVHRQHSELDVPTQPMLTTVEPTLVC
jgi:hypothetical protein